MLERLPYVISKQQAQAKARLLDCHARARPARNSATLTSPPRVQYVEELWRKKQSDVMRFLLRIRCWQYRNGKAITRCSRPVRPEKARHVGYKAKQGYVVYRVRVRRGDRKRPVSKVCCRCCLCCCLCLCLLLLVLAAGGCCRLAVQHRVVRPAQRVTVKHATSMLHLTGCKSELLHALPVSAAQHLRLYC